MTLLFDLCRCHDSACPKSECCQRFLDRRKGHEMTPHSSGMRERPEDEGCEMFIEEVKRE